MALITSAQSGNFNQTSTWTGGVIPGVGDEARASTGHTVTITANATCDEISNAGTGKFVIADGVTLTANVTHKGATDTVNLLEFSANSPAAANVVGNLTAGNGNFRRAAANLGTGTFNITGNCLGGSAGASAMAVLNNSTGTVNITGNSTAGAGTAAHGANNSSTGTVNITGNCTAGSSTGNGAFNNSTGTLSVIGTIQSTQTAAGVAGTNVQQTTILSGPFLTETVRGVAPVYCAAWRWNASPSNSTYMEVMTNDLLVKRNLVTPDNATNFPSASNVRSGTTYGISNSLTGTCAVPPAASVAFGVPVDNTTGTATLSAADIWSYATREITGGTVDTLVNAPDVPTAEEIATEVWDTQTSALTASGAIGTRLKNSSTVATTGAQLAAALS